MRFISTIIALLLLVINLVLSAPSSPADHHTHADLSSANPSLSKRSANAQSLTVFSLVLVDSARRSSCYGTRPISCVKIYNEIDWACTQLSGRAYKLGTPMKGTRRVYRIFNGGLVFWEVVPRDAEKELLLSMDECRGLFRRIQDRCAVGTPGSPKRVTYSGWEIHDSGLVMAQMFN